MARRIFSAGFVWSVIEAKWPGFEAAFLGFDPTRLLFEPDEFWPGEASARLTLGPALNFAPDRPVRIAVSMDSEAPQVLTIVPQGYNAANGNRDWEQSVRDNARFIGEISAEHGGFGRFLADWPSSDQVGLMDLLARRGSRLGGNTGQMLLRFLGWDGFMTSKDVTLCLRDAGLDIAEEVKSKGDLAKVQAQFNEWAKETGLPHTHLSRICALSIGANYPPDQLH